MKGTAAICGKRSWLVMSGLLMLLLGNGWLLQAGRAQEARTVLVADVIITGNHNFAQQSILGNIKTRKGQEFSRATLEDDVRKLVKLGAFKDVRPFERPQTDGTMVVEFVVVEYPNLV